MMEQFSLEDDDMGMFITQTPSVNVDNLDSLLEDSFDFECNEVGKMLYSDISEDETYKEQAVMDVTDHHSR